MTARLFHEGDHVIARFAAGVRFARVTWLDRHSDALCFVDREGRELGSIVGAWTSVDAEVADALGAWS